MAKLFFHHTKERYASAHYLSLGHNLNDCLLAIHLEMLVSWPPVLLCSDTAICASVVYMLIISEVCNDTGIVCTSYISICEQL